MKKFIFSLMIAFIAMFSFSVNANAQSAYEKAKLFDNTYVGVFGGVTTPMTFNHVTPFNAIAGLTLGKNWSPVFGTEVQSGVTFGGNGYNVVGNGYTFVRAINTGVNATLNLTNLFLGYNSTKVFTVQTVTGIGWMHLYSSNAKYSDNSNVSIDDDELTAKTGVRFNWNLGNAKAWAVYVEPAVYWNLTNTINDNVQFNRTAAQLGLAIGVVYNFKTSNGTHNFKVWNVGAMNDEINSLRVELAKKPKEVVRTVVETKSVNTPATVVIYFANNSSTLTDGMKKVLDNVTAGTVDVTGYTDEYGAEAYNKRLSVNRAETVAKYLRTAGKTVKTVVGKGETGDIVARVVVVSPSTK